MKLRSKIKKIGFLSFLSVNSLLTTLAFGTNIATAQDSAIAGLSRGEAIDLTVKSLDLEKKNQDFLNECDRDLEACTFTFSSRSNFSEISLDPLILYPDVYPAYRYYKSINLATKLDLVRGYFEEGNSPFKPEQPITEVEALKLVMGASKVMNWKEKFELSVEDSKSWIKFNLSGQQWWYGRYLLAAVEKGFWQGNNDRPAEGNLSREEFLKLLENANRIVAGGQTTSLVDSQVDTYGQGEKKAEVSANIGL
jgi:hypothetical protein